MIEIVDRQRQDSHIRLLLNNEDVLLDKEDQFFNKLPTHNFIRIKDKDYADLPDIGEIFTHFNLQVSNHIVGEIYILPKIIKPGYLKEDEEVLPLLDFTNAYYAECINVKEHVHYDDLVENDFEFSLPTIKNKEQLKNAILERYTQSMPLLSKEKIISLGVSITTLKIIGRV